MKGYIRDRKMEKRLRASRFLCNFERDIAVLGKQEKFRIMLLGYSIVPEILPKQVVGTIQNVNHCHPFERVQKFEIIPPPEPGFFSKWMAKKLLLYCLFQIKLTQEISSLL
jgi:hypothetical protein